MSPISRQRVKLISSVAQTVFSLGWGMAAIGVYGAEPPAGEINRYNVLFIAVDDLRPELGCYGVDYARTPNLDRFAATALRFTRHYVSVATCGASRFAMLTGRSPRNSGVTSGNNAFSAGPTALDPRELAGAQTMPELFRRSGYHTCLLGKISHTADGRVFAYDGTGDGQTEMPNAWDESLTPMGSWQRGWGIFFAYANGRHREDGSGYMPLWEFDADEDEQLPDGLLASRAIERLQEYQSSGDRFFMGLGFFKPHLPFVATRGDWEAFAEHDIPLPRAEKIQSPYFSKSGEFYKYQAEHEKTHPLADDAIRNSRRAYLACVRYVDRQIGRVLDTLRISGLAKDTVVVVWGDHGWHLGEQQIWAKHTPFERANRSVLMISVPGMRTAGKASSSLAASIDIYPTLLEVCRPSFRKVRFALDGKSLVPILNHERTRVRDVAISYWRNAVSVRNDRYRLVTTKPSDEDRPDELYDLSEGFDSIENLAARLPEVCQRLATFIKDET